jgi:hypothetical protein
MKFIEDDQPFMGTVQFGEVHMSGEWVKHGDFLYTHLDSNVRQDVSLSATIRADGQAEHTIAVPMLGAKMVILGE